MERIHSLCAFHFAGKEHHSSFTHGVTMVLQPQRLSCAQFCLQMLKSSVGPLLSEGQGMQRQSTASHSTAMVTGDAAGLEFKGTNPLVRILLFAELITRWFWVRAFPVAGGFSSKRTGSQGCGHSPKPARVQEASGQYSWVHGVTLEGGAVQGQEMDFGDSCGTFQLKNSPWFYSSMINHEFQSMFLLNFNSFLDRNKFQVCNYL